MGGATTPILIAETISDAGATIIIAGAVQIVGMVLGFLTLWVKLRYSAEKAEEAALKAQIVESKLDANTVTTRSVEAKTDTIVSQTDGALDSLRIMISAVSERVIKLEDYNRERAHRLIDAINALHLKVATLVAMRPDLTPVYAHPQSPPPEPPMKIETK